TLTKANLTVKTTRREQCRCESIRLVSRGNNYNRGVGLQPVQLDEHLVQQGLAFVLRLQSFQRVKVVEKEQTGGSSFRLLKNLLDSPPALLGTLTLACAKQCPNQCRQREGNQG